MRGVDDPRLAVHATRTAPAWLWSTDGSRVLWANPVAARLFGAANAAELAGRCFGPADPHRRQVAQLAGKLPPDGAVRLERLRGFGARLGALVTCACSRLAFADGSAGVLIAAAEAIGRPMPLIERLRGLVEGVDTPIAVFARDGLFVGSSDAARTLLGFHNLTEAGLDQAREDALRLGRVEIAIGLGHVVLQRVGHGADVGLIARLEPGPVSSPDRAPAPAEPAPPSDLAPVGILAEPIDEAASAPMAPASAAEPEATAASAEELLPAESEAPPPPPEPAAQPEPSAPEPTPQSTAFDAGPDYEAFDTVSEAPAEFSLLGDATAAAEPSIEATPQVRFVPRRHPLRFVWQIDTDDRLAIASDEFIRLIGPHTASHLGERWSVVADRLALDPDRGMTAALATRHTWSGVTLHWPADGTDRRLPIEMSGLPVQDRTGAFAGYRGFGVCRDLEALDHLARLRQSGDDEPRPRSPQPTDRAAAEPAATEPDHRESLDTPVDTPKNVLPFRPTPDARSPSLTPVENNAFHELARQLAARLESDGGAAADAGAAAPVDQAEPEPTVAEQAAAEPAAATPTEWLAPSETPAKGEAARDRVLLDLMPVGVLIYRLDRLLYANPAFLQRMRFPSLAALEEAGGLDALFVEAGVSGSSGSSESGTPITITAAEGAASTTPASGRLHTIDWDGEQALALIFSSPAEPAAEPPAEPATIEADAPPAAGAVDAEELGAILDTTAEGVLLFDEAGQISAANRSAEALFGYDGQALVRHNLIELFAPESRAAVQDYLDSVKSGRAESLLDHGLEALGRVGSGGLFPLTMTIGRTRADGPNFFAVFRDLSQVQKTQTELSQAKRIAERAAGAKADVLARLSHEIRAPLNAIIGFAEVMIEERFGALGNERYADYLKDIRASGERVIGMIDDLLDLSRIETGKLDLAFTHQNLNEVVEQCVGVMQPRANRERIIIRTSLAHQLPPVTADAQALRQIIMNLIGTSIHLANTGGQVIVSTALSDFGEVVLRVRDTGSRLGDDELAAALQPFRTPSPSDHTESAGVSLSLTKALVEANRAQFHIKSAPQSGTLIEVVFSPAPAAV